ncbi:uncharacterized protein LOC144864230 [Branchiostoma floridae x Branchiostoma japonicum]
MGDLLRRRGNGQKDGKGISNSPVKRPHTEQLAPITVGPSTPSHNVRFKKVMVKKTPNVTLLKIRKSLNKSGTQKGADAIDHYFTFSVPDKDALEDKLRPTADEATFTSDGTFQTISNGDQERSQPVGTKTQEIGQTHSDRFFSHYNHTEHGVRSQPETMFDAVEEKTPKMNHRGKDEVPVPYSIEELDTRTIHESTGNATNPRPAPRAQYKPRQTREASDPRLEESSKPKPATRAQSKPRRTRKGSDPRFEESSKPKPATRAQSKPRQTRKASDPRFEESSKPKPATRAQSKPRQTRKASDPRFEESSKPKPATKAQSKPRQTRETSDPRFEESSGEQPVATQVPEEFSTANTLWSRGSAAGPSMEAVTQMMQTTRQGTVSNLETTAVSTAKVTTATIVKGQQQGGLNAMENVPKSGNYE